MTESQDEQQTTPTPIGEACAGESCVQPAAYSSVQEMLDELRPDIAEDFRREQSRLSTRFRRWLAVSCVVWRSKIQHRLSTKRNA